MKVAIVLTLIAALMLTFSIAYAQDTEDLTLQQQIDDLEARLKYFERLAPSPTDTFQPSGEPGYSMEDPAKLHQRVEIADSIALAVIAEADPITKASELRSLSNILAAQRFFGSLRPLQQVRPDNPYDDADDEWILPRGGDTLLLVKAKMFNTGVWHGWPKLGDYELTRTTTMATDYDDKYNPVYYWHVAFEDKEFPVVGVSGWNRLETTREVILFFHVKDVNPWQDGMLTYKHPDSEKSHRYWKLRRD